MHLRMTFATVTGIAFLLMISTQDLRAAEAANPESGERLHVVANAELHGAVVASSAETAKARRSVQEFLARGEVQDQLERMGFESADVSSRAAQLSNSEILRLQSQIMAADQQSRTTGVPVWGWVVIGIAIAIGIAGLAILYQIGNS
jgi:hypothetical protein